MASSSNVANSGVKYLFVFGFLLLQLAVRPVQGNPLLLKGGLIETSHDARPGYQSQFRSNQERYKVDKEPARAEGYNLKEFIVKEAIHQLMAKQRLAEEAGYPHLLQQLLNDVPTVEPSDAEGRQVVADQLGNDNDDAYSRGDDDLVRLDRNYYGWMDFGKRSLDQDEYMYNS